MVDATCTWTSAGVQDGKGLTAGRRVGKLALGAPVGVQLAAAAHLRTQDTWMLMHTSTELFLYFLYSHVCGLRVTCTGATGVALRGHMQRCDRGSLKCSCNLRLQVFM